MGDDYWSIDLSLETMQDVKDKVGLMSCVDCCGRRLQGPVMVRYLNQHFAKQIYLPNNLCKKPNLRPMS